MPTPTRFFSRAPSKKNIQTGTFRVWKDLAHGERDRWFNLWPFETSESRLPNAPWIFEGFPTWMWKSVFGYKARTPLQFGELLKNNFGSSPKVDCDTRALREIKRNADDYLSLLTSS